MIETNFILRVLAIFGIGTLVNYAISNYVPRSKTYHEMMRGWMDEKGEVIK